MEKVKFTVYLEEKPKDAKGFVVTEVTGAKASKTPFCIKGHKDVDRDKELSKLSAGELKDKAWDSVKIDLQASYRREVEAFLGIKAPEKISKNTVIANLDKALSNGTIDESTYRNLKNDLLGR